eukprot:gene11006-7649_t
MRGALHRAVWCGAHTRAHPYRISSFTLLSIGRCGSHCCPVIPSASPPFSMSTPAMESKVSDLEQRANKVEAALASLAGSSSGATTSDAALAEKLKVLLQLMKEDRDECEAIRAQRDDMKEENERLRTQLSKQTYRVQHLLRTIDEMEGSRK